MVAGFNSLKLEGPAACTSLPALRIVRGINKDKKALQKVPDRKKPSAGLLYPRCNAAPSPRFASLGPVLPGSGTLDALPFVLTQQSRLNFVYKLSFLGQFCQDKVTIQKKKCLLISMKEIRGHFGRDSRKWKRRIYMSESIVKCFR